MKVVIFAGGFGSRLGSLTSRTPKPMIKISGKPIIWYIMKYYSHYGLNDFLILSGYKSKVLEDFFSKNNKLFITKKKRWKIKILNTGLNTMTGGRLKRAKKYLKDEKFFCLTYGDGLSDVNILDQIEFHKSKKKLATILAVHPPARFGLLNINKNSIVSKFEEKPINNSNLGWINGGFFVLSSKIFKFIKNDKTVWEREPLENLAKKKQLISFKHEKFWIAMDTIRDKKEIETLVDKNKAPWIKW
tara:strand:+ start:989 stop:1723 length:735 start_codon:yes stop_codon:yes gene_type:complete